MNKYAVIYPFFEAKGIGTCNLSVLLGQGEWNKYVIIYLLLEAKGNGTSNLYVL